MDYLEYYTSFLGAPRFNTGVNCMFCCPKCDNTEGYHLRVNVVTSVYLCFRCGEKGNSTTFAKMMGVAPPTDLAAGNIIVEPYDQGVASEVYTYLLKCMQLASTDYDELTTKRGIVNPEQFGVKTLQNAAKELKRYFCSDQLLLSGLFYEKETVLVPRALLTDGRLLIPYISEDKVIFIRTRGEGIKYLCPKNAKAGGHVWGTLTPRKQTVIVTEGEFKAMSAASHGANIVALPGMQSSHRAFVDMIKDSAIKRVIICFDNQVNHMKDVDNAAHKLANATLKLPDISVTRVTLPLNPDIDNGEKMDIDTYIASSGWAAFQKLIRVGGVNYVKR